MPLLCERNPSGFLIIAVLLCAVFLTAPAQGQLRNMKVGDKMPEFSLPVLTVSSDSNDPNDPNDPNGLDTTVFTYKHDRGRVLGLVFSSANQKQSQQAVADIEKIVAELNKKGLLFDFVNIVNKSSKKESGQPGKESSSEAVPVLLDEEYKLWGKLGVIAQPTMLVVEKDGEILWVRPGYGYDFAPSLRLYLDYALGITKEKPTEEPIKVRTLKIDDGQAKLKRHLIMASGLEKKGRLESAIVQVRKARELDPNSIDAVLALGKLLCRVGRGEEALDAIEAVKPVKRLDKAGVLLISGWANRQGGQFDIAEESLRQAAELDPKSSRILFELGKVYHAKDQYQQAAEEYYRALSLVFAEPVEPNFPIRSNN